MSEERARPSRRLIRPRLEALEDRLVPAPVAIAESLQGTAGEVFSGVVATFQDASHASPTAYSAAIYWGDGAMSVGSVYPNGTGFNVTGTHTYQTAGSFPVQVIIADAAGDQIQASHPWQTLANMITPRYGFAAVGTPDGFIYAIGGWDKTNNLLASVERYDPTTNSWTGVASLNRARGWLAATVGTDGSIYAIGGEVVNATHTAYVEAGTVERYDPSVNTWTVATPLNTPRARLSAATGADGTIYAIGGAADAKFDPVTTVERYDPTSNTWSNAASLNVPREDFGAATGPDGSIYAVGGFFTLLGVTATAERYDPITDTWSQIAPLPTALGYTTVVAANGGIFSIGGVDGNSKLTSAVERYDTNAGEWAPVDGVNTLRTNCAAAAGADGRIYLLGGSDINQQSVFGTVEAADTSLGTAEVAAPAPLAANGQNLSLLEGQTFSGEVATFTGADPYAMPRDFSAAIDWGDGQLTAGTVVAMGGGSFAVTGTHNYLTFGTEPIAVDITEDNGSEGQATGTAQVSEAPATQLVVSGFLPAGAGTPESFSVSAVNQFGDTVTDYSGTVYFFATGSSSLPVPTTLTNGTGNFSATLFTAGLQTLGVTDGTLNGAQNDIAVSPGSAANLTIISGGTQTTAVNTLFAQPFEVRVTDAYGNPLSTTVTFTAPAFGPGGTFTGGNATASVQTDSNGVAMAPAFAANGAVGRFTVTATVGALSATFDLANTPGTPALLAALAGSGQSATVATSYATLLQVQVTDAFGNPLSTAGITVTFTAPASGAGGTFGSSTTVTATTGANGVATAPAAFTANHKAGSFVLTAAASGLTGAAFDLTNTPGAPAAITAVAGTPQKAQVGTAYLTALEAKVTDKFGNPLSGLTVTFTVHGSHAGGAFSGTETVTTDNNGLATAPILTANHTAGSFTVSAATTGLSKTATFDLTNTLTAAVVRPHRIRHKDRVAVLAREVYELFGWHFEI